MAGTVTPTEITHTSLKKAIFAWTCTALGAANGTTTAPFDGRCVGLITIPGTGGDAPSLNYDVTITDADGHDVLLAAGMNRHTSDTEYVTEASLAGVAGSKLTLNITNAGDTKKGTVILFIR